MLAKHKILIPSLETRPKGKKTVKIRLAPPTLFVDKWYFQKDICDLSLFNLNVTMADLRFPFCSPQTDNTCVSFQVLKSCYNNYLSINKFNNDSGNTQLTAFLKLAFPDSGTIARSINQLNTFKTEGNISHPKLQKATGSDNNPSSGEYFAKKDALWGDPIYLNTQSQTRDKINK